MTSKPIVVKLGGSLLELPELGLKLRQWLDRHSTRQVILIVGGGTVVEAIRRLDELHHLGNEQAHWLAIHAMSRNSRVVASLLPESTVVESLSPPVVPRSPDRGTVRRPCHNGVVVESLSKCGQAWEGRRTPILDPLRFMQEDEHRADKLPASWSVTSDSIAARVAHIAEAGELILLKSCALPRQMSWEEMAETGLVDAWFPRLATLLPSIRWVNFAEEN